MSSLEEKLIEDAGLWITKKTDSYLQLVQTVEDSTVCSFFFKSREFML